VSVLPPQGRGWHLVQHVSWPHAVADSCLPAACDGCVAAGACSLLLMIVLQRGIAAAHCHMACGLLEVKVAYAVKLAPGWALPCRLCCCLPFGDAF
jgi:hypothetical protein